MRSNVKTASQEDLAVNETFGRERPAAPLIGQLLASSCIINMLALIIDAGAQWLA